MCRLLGRIHSLCSQNMTRYQKGWRAQANYLSENTPLSVREAEVLSLMRHNYNQDEIANKLTLRPPTVEEDWHDIRDYLRNAQTLTTIMGPHPWGDGDTREHDQIDDSPWTQLSSGALNYSDEERTRIELELYVGKRGPINHRFLLVEREIVDDTEYSTTTTEKRSAHGPNGLRDYVYNDVDILDEYYLYHALLHKGGVDPGAKGARPPESALKQDFSSHELQTAEERGLERVERHGVDGSN